MPLYHQANYSKSCIYANDGAEFGLIQQLIQSTLEGISKVVKLHGGYGWDGAAIALSTVQQTVPHLPHDFEEWDELCRSYGFEYVDGESQGRNEYHGTVCCRSVDHCDSLLTDSKSPRAYPGFAKRSRAMTG